jgi:hypothetical protein
LGNDKNVVLNGSNKSSKAYTPLDKNQPNFSEGGDKMVEDYDIVRPHVRMWQFTRCVLGNTENISKRTEGSRKDDSCHANERGSRTNGQEYIIPQRELNKIC